MTNIHFRGHNLRIHIRIPIQTLSGTKPIRFRNLSQMTGLILYKVQDLVHHKL